MAATLRYFMLPDDERAFFRVLARHELTIYPEIVPIGWEAPRASDEVVASLLERPGDPAARAKELGVEKVEDRGAIGAAVDEVLAAHAAEVARYRAGEKKLLGVLVGAAMKRTASAADAGLVRSLLIERLSS